MLEKSFEYFSKVTGFNFWGWGFSVNLIKSSIDVFQNSQCMISNGRVVPFIGKIMTCGPSTTTSSWRHKIHRVFMNPSFKRVRVSAQRGLIVSRRAWRFMTSPLAFGSCSRDESSRVFFVTFASSGRFDQYLWEKWVKISYFLSRGKTGQSFMVEN